MSLFLRLLEDEDKGAALEAAVRSVVEGKPDGRVFEVEPVSFEQVPGAPFAYWVSESIRKLFAKFKSFEDDDRTTKVGLGTTDDFRFLRTWWEILPEGPSDNFAGQYVCNWPCFSKGGAFSPFYIDIPLVIDWKGDGSQLKAKVVQEYGNYGKRVYNEEFFYRPGITWPLRARGFSPQVMPAGCIFSVRGYAAFSSADNLLMLIGLGNSRPFDFLFKIMLGRFGFPEFVVGVLQKVPIPDYLESVSGTFNRLAHDAWSRKRDLDTANLFSHAFVLPALLQSDRLNLLDCTMAWVTRVEEADQALATIQAEIDERCFDLYGFDKDDRTAALGAGITAEGGTNLEDDEEAQTDALEINSASLRCNSKDLAADLFDWLVGVAFGRFDVRLATGERKLPTEPEPFDPLPICSPGMLTGDDGLPLNAPPLGYPLNFPTDGVLVDDAGIDDTVSVDTDLLHRVHHILNIIWGENAVSIETELSQLLGVRSLRDWLRRPTAYFADHLSRYSKSRRKAPICWPLSTESGSYSLWLYYPRLTDQTLYTCVNEYIDPKLREIERDLFRLLGTGQPDSKAQKQIDALVELQRELKSMREELLRVAELPYKPNQNDGVLITAAPLWRLFRHKPWQKDLKKCWDELESGKYDWSHLAYAIWPDRVRETCKQDKSIAIAHGLEELYSG